MSATEVQTLVDRHFAAVAAYWRDLYKQKGVFAVIHQHRFHLVLDIVQRLPLPARARILDIGCGAGVLSVELARRGFAVDSFDSVPAMVELTRTRAAESGVTVSAALGDAHNIQFPDRTFDVVIAMGVTPFLHSLPDALSEISRVLKPGGTLVINADNKWRITRLFDPLVTPLLSWPRRLVKTILRWTRLRKATEPQIVYMYSSRAFDRHLARRGLAKREAHMIGFGPFTFFERNICSEPAALRLHRTLQRWCNRRVPIIRSTGTQYIVCAGKGATVS